MHTIVKAKEAYYALDTLVNYCHQKWMEVNITTGNILEHYYDIWFIDRMKPYIMLIWKEMKWETIDKNDFYTTLKFTSDWNPWQWKCEKCSYRDSYSTACHWCGRKNITLANWENDYSLIK